MHQEQALTSQGRPFDRPEEELTDQGLRFDVLTVLSRRNLLRALGLGATAVTLAACGTDASTSGTPSTSSSTSPGEIPDETAGPYPGDGSNGPDVLERSGIIRSDNQVSITDATKAIATSQVALPEDACHQVYATDGHEASVATLAS